jgi:hypothetical protein
MSVPNPKVNKSNTQNNFLNNPQINDDDQWQDANGSEIAYLIKPNEVVTFTPLNNVKPVKGGQAAVVEAYVYTYINQQGQMLLNNQNATLMVQKVPMDKIQSLYSQYGNKVIIKMVNKGKQQGKRYYTYDIKYKVTQ